MQVFGVLAALAIIITFSFKKVSLEKIMFAATVVMALSSGLPLLESARIIWQSFIDRGTLELAVAVGAIGAFSTIMQETGYLDHMVQGLSGFLGSLKAAIMAVPALMGSMPVLGGAAVSAPLVDRLGDGLSLSSHTKAGVNLVFRHGMFFLFPFTPTMILINNMLGISVWALISKLWPYGLAFWAAGYWVLLRKTPSPQDEGLAATRTQDFRMKSLTAFARYGSPLLLALLLSLVFGVPLWASMTAGILLAAFMAYLEKRPLPSSKTLIKGSNLPQVAAMFWIMAFKEFAASSPVLPSLVLSSQDMGISPVVLAIVLPVLFGFVSAHHATTVGVMLPILMPAGVSSKAILYFTSVIYASSFLAYFSSPLHLCQILTCRYFDVSLAKVYKSYWPILASVAVIMALYAGITAKLI